MRSFLQKIIDRFVAVEKRLTRLETYDGTNVRGVHSASYAINGVNVVAAASYTSSDVRGSNGVSNDALGIVGMLRATAAGAGQLYIDSDTPDQYSCRVEFAGAATRGNLVFVRLSSTGTVTVTAVGANMNNIYLSVVGYWK